MPAPHPLARVRTASRAGTGGVSQDRVFTTATAVIVLDGASNPEPTDRGGGWLADYLGAELADQLTTHPAGDLADTLHAAIDAIADQFDLMPGRSPTSTVSIVRWTPEQVDALVLGDTPIVVRTRDGAVHVVRDDRLTQVGDRATYRRALAAGGFATAHPDAHRALVTAQRAARNQPDGYWIAEADPQAAYHAVRARWPLAEVSAVLVLTDGVADGVDTYRSPADWLAALSLAEVDPAELIDLVHRQEQGDPTGVRWPRAKCHDDKAAALVQFVTADVTDGPAWPGQ